MARAERQRARIIRRRDDAFDLVLRRDRDGRGADVAGQLRALVPASGAPLGPGYVLKASVAPAAAPVPFGTGRLLVPLTDGTLMVVPVAALRE